MIHDFPVAACALAVAAIFILGLAKAGVKGAGVIIVMLLALAFGSRASTGILMPLLIAGDLFAVAYYGRYTQWKYLWRLLPWMVAGVLIAVFVGRDLPETQFRLWMAVLILISAGLMLRGEYRKNTSIPRGPLPGIIFGSLAGFATMLGNLAGPFAELYFLAMRLPKNNFIGTAAWLFLIINVFKLPFHIWVWHTITPRSLVIDAWLLPALIAGLIAGAAIVARIREVRYRRLILILTVLGAVFILLG